ncbi:FMN-dependent NADH-azoreductase [Nitrosotalea sinensis]|jgi:FMN-dependent NADH-azoreductase|uniref:FMN-dependent NADH-azoreductase n=1 Tax=Nitrosotalea sinensis TaxID=1499975 RepID=A0A2H1EHT0_9ARCH|nr:NAD(P)H-dependent oxidoreductase [Candidatus Nitrosotalea sinensis]SHO45557.1 FMN-dependent NADH-azoreductase [Candidatus Nitrosotalea sinensis]
MKMTKTLIVKYTPRNERSSTKKMLDAFVSGIKNSEIEEIDLTKDVPDLFLEKNLAAYIHRNYLGEELDDEQKKILSKMDRMTKQLKSADVVVVAYPMNNFSMPAPVKAWFDSVMLKGETWAVKDGKYLGLMGGKKALALVSAGGMYDQGPMTSWEHALSLTKVEFQFMGYSDIRGILAGGMNAGEDTKNTNLKQSISQVRQIAQQWYSEA